MEAFYSTTHTRLHLCQLTPEQHSRTCNYWFTVTTSQALPHIAFTTREELEDWLTICGLALPLPLSPHGEHAVQHIQGTYRTAHFLSYDAFYALNAIAHRKVWSNGQRTLAIVTEDESGIRSINTLNPNMKYRIEYDFRTGAARPAFEDRPGPV